MTKPSIRKTKLSNKAMSITTSVIIYLMILSTFSNKLPRKGFYKKIPVHQLIVMIQEKFQKILIVMIQQKFQKILIVIIQQKFQKILIVIIQQKFQKILIVVILEKCQEILIVVILDHNKIQVVIKIILDHLGMMMEE